MYCRKHARETSQTILYPWNSGACCSSFYVYRDTSIAYFTALGSSFKVNFDWNNHARLKGFLFYDQKRMFYTLVKIYVYSMYKHADVTKIYNLYYIEKHVIRLQCQCVLNRKACYTPLLLKCIKSKSMLYAYKPMCIKSKSMLYACTVNVY